ncbi:MAG TPA: SRPBCC domain-containing protein [Polyangiaceae bacterium]
MSQSVTHSIPRAVADVSRGLILASVEIAAPIERVFGAITSDEITKWWGSPDEYHVTEYTADVRPGGKWQSTGVGADGHAFSVGGEFREIDPPRLVVHTWVAPWDGNSETVVTYRLEPIEGGTRVTVRHEGFAGRDESCRGHGTGWERVLGWLGRHFASDAKYFMCRLLPPRPSFALDMNKEEAAMMQEHAAYWRGMLARGVAIVFGPVLDPKAPYGLGIVRVSSEVELESIRDADPAIKSGRGLKYEVTPMIRAVHRS